MHLCIICRGVKKAVSFQEWLEMKLKQEEKVTKEKKTSQLLLQAQQLEAAVKKKERAEQAYNKWLRTKNIPHAVSF